MKAFEQVLKYNLRLTGRQIYSDPSPSGSCISGKGFVHKIFHIARPRLLGSLIHPWIYPDSSLLRSSNIRIPCLSGSRISWSLAYPDLLFIRTLNILIPRSSAVRISGSLAYPDLEYPDLLLIRTSNILVLRPSRNFSGRTNVSEMRSDWYSKTWFFISFQNRFFVFVSMIFTSEARCDSIPNFLSRFFRVFFLVSHQCVRNDVWLIFLTDIPKLVFFVSIRNRIFLFFSIMVTWIFFRQTSASMQYVR